MKTLIKLLIKAGILRMPVVEEVILTDSDMVELDEFGHFNLSRDGHIYRVKEKLYDIATKDKYSVCLNYLGESKKVNKRHMDKFERFEKFKKDYNYIKKSLEGKE
jgi:hypothetical protein